MCIGCDERLTIEHILLACSDFIELPPPPPLTPPRYTNPRTTEHILLTCSDYIEIFLPPKNPTPDLLNSKIKEGDRKK